MASGCSNENKKELDIGAFCDQVIKQVDYDDELILLPDRVVSDYYDLFFEGLEDYAIYVSATSATSNELAVMKLYDSKAVESAKKAVDKRIKNQIATYENYRPDEKFRLESALIISQDGYLLLSVSNHNDEVKKIFYDNLK
jgi:hypothetical protein